MFGWKVIGTKGNTDFLKGLAVLVHMVKNRPAMQETQVQSLGPEDPLEKAMASHSNILAWRIPWTEEPGRLQSMGLQRARRNWVTTRLTLAVHMGEMGKWEGETGWGRVLLETYKQNIVVKMWERLDNFISSPIIRGFKLTKHIPRGLGSKMRINVDVGKLYVGRCVSKEFSMNSFYFLAEIKCWLICKVR